jgi:hypothetical protein
MPNIKRANSINTKLILYKQVYSLNSIYKLS